MHRTHVHHTQCECIFDQYARILGKSCSWVEWTYTHFWNERSLSHFITEIYRKQHSPKTQYATVLPVKRKFEGPFMDATKNKEQR